MNSKYLVCLATLTLATSAYGAPYNDDFGGTPPPGSTTEAPAPDASPAAQTRPTPTNSKLIVPPAKPAPPLPPNMIIALPTDHPLYVERGDIVRFQGRMESQLGLVQSFLLVDNQSEQETKLTGALDDEFKFDWKTTHIDRHDVAVGYIQDNGLKKYAVKLGVVVLPTSPVVVDGFTPTATSDFTVTLRPIISAGMTPSYAKFYLNDKLVSTKTSLHAVIPINKLAPGKYSFRYEAFDGRDSRFASTTQTIEVVSRVGSMHPSQVTIQKPGDKTTLSLDLAQGVKIAKVDYYVNNQIVATGNAAPYSADADLSALTTGSYPAMAKATADDGTTYDSNASTIDLKNKPIDDANAAQVAAAQKQEDEVNDVLKADQERKQKKLLAATANMAAAAKNHLVSFLPTSKLKSRTLHSETDYFVTIKITNSGHNAIGPFSPKLVFDDTSKVALSAYDPSAYDSDGKPTHPLDNSEMIVPGDGSVEFPYFGIQTSGSKLAKPVKIELYPNVTMAIGH